MHTIDYETEAIDGNPVWNPPVPVGVSIKHDDKPSEYLAWGHPSENNTTREKATARLQKIFESNGLLLFHNAPFDLSVGATHLALPFPAWQRIHDTQFSIFLTDPYATSFSLKPSAARILGVQPDEAEELKAWILAHVPEARQAPSTWGAYISKAPGALVGKYACGDTDRTYALHVHLAKQIELQELGPAYQREQALMPILFHSSRRGIRVDRGRLENDIRAYRDVRDRCDRHIWKKLGVGEFNIDSGDELAAALDRSGMVKPEDWILTPKGKRSTARGSLNRAIKNPGLLKVLRYRGVLDTSLGTFAEPWYRLSASDGRIHTEWNQVRGDKSNGDLNGTRTGRLSSKNPNFQNVINVSDIDVPAGLPEMINMRSYLLPDEGKVWLKRDFSAQEMRIMAHFAEGKLYEAFRADPKTDPHTLVKGIIDGFTGGDMPRKYVKITGFGIMYGRGVPNLSAALGVSIEEGQRVRDSYFMALPEVRVLSNDTRNRGKRGQAIRTWGGRLYFREPNLERDLSYKLLNYLIQGSAADQTKQSIIEWEAVRHSEDDFLSTVHDENNIQAPIGREKEAMKLLRESMNADRFDVPFLSDGFRGFNWAGLEECE